MKKLYHYSSNVKCFSILESKTLRMSDIQKSNDYMELERFFPDIFNHIMQQYNAHPFSFCYDGKRDNEAIDTLLNETHFFWARKFESGSFSNFVACFSEACDALTQWQAYADNAQGCCIGFSLPALKQYCKQSNGVLRLEKVKYLSSDELTEVMRSEAVAILAELKGLREWIVENMTHDDSSPHTDGLLGFNFSVMLGNVFTDFLVYKDKAFAHEKEWRIFFSDQSYKNADWVLGEDQELIGPNGFSETLSFLRNKIAFNITTNDIIPYFPICFSEFKQCPVVELWVGPKSNIRSDDLTLYMRKYGYESTQIKFSEITYR